jgi:hypothetical protein
MHQGPIEDHGDVYLNRQYFTYVDANGYVAGSLLSILFTVNAPASAVWPVFQDFNLWQNSYEHYYSSAVGDLEGGKVRLSLKRDDPDGTEYDVTRVIPEHAIVLTQPIPTERDGLADYPGGGGVSPGFHVFTLTERNGSVEIAVMMQHASVMATPPVPETMTSEDALAPWREVVAEGPMKWRDYFIPTLKKLVEQA